jgi:hypothetical protein
VRTLIARPSLGAKSWCQIPVIEVELLLDGG